MTDAKMDVAQTRLDSVSRLRFCCDVRALELLCSPEAVSQWKIAVESLNAKDARSFLRGYRLAVATPLSELLWFVVDHADLMGLQQDDRLLNWLHFRTPAQGESLLSAISEPTSELGRLCYVFNDLATALRRAEGGLTDTTAAIEKCRGIAKAFNEVLGVTEVVSLDSGEALPGRESLLSLCVAERIVDYAEYAPSIVSLAHSWVWGNGEEFSPADDRFVLAAETHLSHVSLSPFGKGVPREWWDGTLVGLDLITQLNGNALSTNLNSDANPSAARDWINELADLVNPSRPEGKRPSQKYALTEFSHSAIRKVIRRLGVNMDTVSSKHRLAAILGVDRARLISDAGATGALELEVMLTGAVSTCRDSKVHVLVLTHSVYSDDREWISIAFRLPMYGLISNASRWFLFYKMYHKGFVFDNDVARAAKAVEELLLRFEDKLEVEEIWDLGSEDFLPSVCCLPFAP